MREHEEAWVTGLTAVEKKVDFGPWPQRERGQPAMCGLPLEVSRRWKAKGLAGNAHAALQGGLERATVVAGHFRDTGE